MMNQYHHSQTYPTFPSQHHFHLSNATTTTVFQPPPPPTTNYNYAYTTFPPAKHHYDSSITENPYEQYPIDNSISTESIYHPIQSYDQCHNYSNTDQSFQDFSSLSNNQPKIIEQSLIEQKPIVNEAIYKWMQIKRTPAKASGIVLKYIPSDKNKKNDE
jgi:hypothetical protein